MTTELRVSGISAPTGFRAVDGAIALLASSAALARRPRPVPAPAKYKKGEKEVSISQTTSPSPSAAAAQEETGPVITVDQFVEQKQLSAKAGRQADRKMSASIKVTTTTIPRRLTSGSHRELYADKQAL